MKKHRKYTTRMVALPDGSWHCHRKLHAFVHPNLSSGSEYTVFDTHLDGRSALICYDNNLIENARITALLGRMFCWHRIRPAAATHAVLMRWAGRSETLGAAPENPEAIEAEFRGDRGRGWLMRWLPARAHDNGMFLVFSNGVGRMVMKSAPETR